jgi:hypothetical protein
MTDWILSANVPAVLAFALFAVALVRGEAPERILSAALLIVACFGMLCRAVLGLEAGWAHAGMDALVFVAIASVALYANRLYPTWLGAAQIVKLVSHAWRLSLAKPAALALLIMDHAAFDLQLAVMAIGLAFQIARRKRLPRPYLAWTR